tara:strand:+ start:27 stop:1064 length:1038 start_codon:yes stop_codon:yes gene_type:complete
MKTSPFKIYGGVTPLKQDPRLMVTASNGVSVPKANLKDYENSLKEANKDIAKENIKNKSTEPIVNENLLNVIPGSGEIVDAKNAIKDFVNEDYGGAALNMAGFFLPFVPGGVLKAGGKSIMNYLKKMPGVDDFLKSGKKMTKEQEINFKKGFAEADGNPIAGGVGGAQKTPQEVIDNNLKINKQLRYGDPDATVYPAIKNEQELAAMTNQIKQGHQSKFKQIEADMPNFNTGQLSQKNVKNLGSNNSGQTIYEVTFPNGSKQKFWESTGTGKKAVKLSGKNKHLNAENSKGYFGPVMGHMDGSKAGFSSSWFVKTDGWERGYGSMMIEDTQIWLKSLNDAGKLPK